VDDPSSGRLRHGMRKRRALGSCLRMGDDLPAINHSDGG
jgi:hypothetical protein